MWFVVAQLTLAIGSCEAPLPERTSSLGSRVELAAGEVWLEQGGHRSPLGTGAMLPADAVVQVGNGGRALLTLDSGAGVFLRAGTVVALDAGGVELRSGELWASVPRSEGDLGRFAVGDVHVSASGAAFDLVKNKDGAAVYVARGMAVIESSGGRAEVESGERAGVKAGSVPAVAPMGYWEDWTGGMADQEMARWSGSGAGGRLYGIDPARAAEPPQELQITSQKVRAVIRDGVAHTTVDQRFFNPTGTDLEGWYWFTVPAGAAVERFAWEVDGKLVEGEMIERGRAAAAYREAVESRSDPALLPAVI
jgi:hypothetical protein